MKVKIKSDGTAAGTHVLLEDGSELGNVTCLSFMISADSNEEGLAEAILHLVGASCEIECDATIRDRDKYE